MIILFELLKRSKELKCLVPLILLFLHSTASSAQRPPAITDYCQPASVSDSHTPIVCKPVYFDVSAKRLDQIHLPQVQKKGPLVINEVRRLPIVQPKGGAGDPVIQATPGSALTTVDGGFEGIGKGTGYQPTISPPDTTLAIGPEHIVEWVNTDFAVLDKKTHNVLYGPTAGKALWADFAGAEPKNPARRCASTNDGDPIVMYDRIAKRWLFSQFAYHGGPLYLQCIAISNSPDPLGTYARYAYSFDLFNDYGKFGLWPDAYYATFNMFQSPTGPFKEGRVCAFERTNMLLGKSSNMICFSLPKFSGVLPADLDGSTPPVTDKVTGRAPGIFVNLQSNGLNLWEFTANWSDPKTSKLLGPSPIDGVKPFSWSCRDESSEARCRTVPQRDSDVLLDSMGDRLMYRLSYRSFGDHETLVANHAVSVPNAAGKSPIAFRWYEITKAGPKFTVSNSGTYAPDKQSRWMGSIATDKVGNIAIAYTTSGDSDFSSIRYSGRSADTSDKASMLGNEIVLATSESSQSIYSWGDYTTLAVDPVDDCTFWFIAQYLAQGDGRDWHTKISNIRFKNCH